MSTATADASAPYTDAEVDQATALFLENHIKPVAQRTGRPAAALMDQYDTELLTAAICGYVMALRINAENPAPTSAVGDLRGPAAPDPRPGAARAAPHPRALPRRPLHRLSPAAPTPRPICRRRHPMDPVQRQQTIRQLLSTATAAQLRAALESVLDHTASAAQQGRDVTDHGIDGSRPDALVDAELQARSDLGDDIDSSLHAALQPWR
ncbi:hypothetical protein AB0N09_28110 [Streptomyces erythrochromogenes]|uniref:hypothetical protein n=1 Tax=Streptomyces erythrochromogenes TaxID=285574 RepID=UPI003420B803